MRNNAAPAIGGFKMAHECPDCGMLCHCNGDIDDCCNNFDEDIARCNHCDGKAHDDFEDEYDGDYYNDGQPDEDV